MVEKLSVKAPDGPTKVKILTAIAEEHNIKWESKWFKDEAEMPSIDLLQEQHTERVNTIQMRPLNFEISDDPPERLAGEEVRSATSSQCHVHADADSSAFPHSVSSHTDTRFGSSSERATSNPPFGTAENVLLTSRENGNMEFKDATTAELSTHGKIIINSSSGPVTSSIYAGPKGSSVYPGSILQQENVERNHTNNSFNPMSSRMSGVQHDENEKGNMQEGSESRTFNDEHTQYGIEGEFGEVKTISYPVQDMRKSRDSLFSPNTSRAESNIFQSSCHEYKDESEYSAFDDEYSIFSQQNNQSKNDRDDGSLFNSHQGTATHDDWHGEDAHHSGFYGVRVDNSFREERKRDPFPGSDEQKNVFQSSADVFVSTDNRSDEIDVEEMDTHTYTGVVFDESGSDDDEYTINNVQESYDLPSPGKSVPKNFLSHEENHPENLHHQSSFSRHLPYGLEVSESFQESPIYEKLSEPVPVEFDSDGASSDSEKELRNELIESQKSSKSLRFPLQSPVPVSSAEKIGAGLNFGQVPGGRRNTPLQNLPYTTSGVSPWKKICSQRSVASDNISEDSPNSPMETTRFRSRNTHYLKWNDDASSMPRSQTRDTMSKVSSASDKSVSSPKEAEISRASSSNEKAPSRENSTKNPSHVHPKLPEFESFTAHFQSLRTNR